MKSKNNKFIDFIKRDLWVIPLDILAVNGAYYLALIARVSLDYSYRDAIIYYRDDFLSFAPWYTLACLIVFSLFRLYGGMWKKASVNDMNRIILANLTTSIIQVAGTLLFVAPFPKTYYILGALFQAFFIGLIRFSYRIINVKRRKLLSRQDNDLDDEDEAAGFLRSSLKNLWIVPLDIIAVNGAYYLALIIRFTLDHSFQEAVIYYRDDFLTFAPWYTVACIIVFLLFRLYGGMWKYAGINDMNRILLANVATCIIQVGGTLLFVSPMPKTYYILGALFQVLLISIIRFSYRIIIVERRKLSAKQDNALIVGGGEEAHFLHKVLDAGLVYRPICFVDANNQGKMMDGLPTFKTIEEALLYNEITCIFIADLNLSTSAKEEIREICKQNKIDVKDYTSFFLYSGEYDSLFRIKDITKETQAGEHFIPFSPPDIGDSEIGEVVEAIQSGWITTGPRTKLLERRLAAYIETGKADVDTEREADRWNGRVVCLGSATAAEELNLRILGIKPGDEVIVPAYTYTASASSAIHCGATVKFVDIQRDGDKRSHCPEMDYEKLEAAVTDKTKAIITVDLGGIVCDYDKVYEIVEKKKNLFRPLEPDGTPLGNLSARIQKSIGRVAVVADCAHSLGASRVFGNERKYCGAIADFTSFSFHAVKNFTTAEGGASTWKPIDGVTNAEIYKFYQLLSLHGQSKDALAKTKVGAWEYDIIGPWYKCNMTDIMAAIGLRQLDRYPGLLERRANIIKKYDETCDELGLEHLHHHVEGMDSSNHLYFIRVPGISVEKRNQIIEQMAVHGVSTNVHYKPLPMMTAYKSLGWDIKDFPNTYAYYENLLTLPLHTLLTDDDVDFVCEALKETILKETVLRSA